jgi:hypothetical protein
MHRERFDQAREQAARAGAEVVAQLPDQVAVDELALAMLYLGEGAKRHRLVVPSTRLPARTIPQDPIRLPFKEHRDHGELPRCLHRDLQ